MKCVHLDRISELHSCDATSSGRLSFFFIATRFCTLSSYEFEKIHSCEEPSEGVHNDLDEARQHEQLEDMRNDVNVPVLVSP